LGGLTRGLRSNSAEECYLKPLMNNKHQPKQ
jgi:hypothetical protein